MLDTFAFGKGIFKSQHGFKRQDLRYMRFLICFQVFAAVMKPFSEILKKTSLFCQKYLFFAELGVRISPLAERKILLAENFMEKNCQSVFELFPY